MIATLEETQSRQSASSGAVVASLENVSKNYGEVCALRNVNFAVHAGQVVALLGPNGAGKTTAVKNRVNRRLRKANEEIEHLAKLAERERIARDLHDVLGHTLSVITLKSELAGEGMQSGDIAAELSLSEGTVRNYLSEAISKMGGSNRVEASRFARTKGWL
jgi:DNA-binding NarL/FixJ family response regulator